MRRKKRPFICLELHVTLINIENKGAKRIYPSITRRAIWWTTVSSGSSIDQCQRGNPEDYSLLWSLTLAHFLDSYHPSVHTANSVSAHRASTSSSALSPSTPPAGKKDGHSAGWLSEPLCPLAPTSPTSHSPQSLLPQFPPLTRGIEGWRGCFPFLLWCVTLCCRFVF